jgi:hypothetical protein
MSEKYVTTRTRRGRKAPIPAGPGRVFVWARRQEDLDELFRQFPSAGWSEGGNASAPEWKHWIAVAEVEWDRISEKLKEEAAS